MPPPERRFSEAEVAAILERATAHDEAGRAPVPEGRGLTLAQIQDIGRQVGVAPEVIAESAYLLDDRGGGATRGFLGLPLRVERVVPLPRRITDDEWERIVVDLREIFDARGRVRQDGSLRQWTNGNLQVLLEPTATGQRLRLRTFKGNAPGMVVGGLAAAGAGGAGLLGAVMGGATSDVGMMAALSLAAVAGAGMVGTALVGLFPWARRRREQMAEVAARVAALAERAGS